MSQSEKRVQGTHWRSSSHYLLLLYDSLLYAVCALIFLWIPFTSEQVASNQTWIHAVLGLACCLGMRMIFSVYRIIWRYGGIGSYLRIMTADGIATIAFVAIELLLGLLFKGKFVRVSVTRAIALMATSLLAALAIRMAYRYFFKQLQLKTTLAPIYQRLMKLAGADTTVIQEAEDVVKSSIICAIYGADTGSIVLAREMVDNPLSVYRPVCFIDAENRMAGHNALTIPIYGDNKALPEKLRKSGVQTIVIAGKSVSRAQYTKLAAVYEKQGYSVKLYEQPSLRDATGKPKPLSLNPEDLLFRKQIYVTDPATNAYYRGKTILITGGGGSIGSELCRQVARMEPEKLIILDIAENGAYDVQQELWQKHGRSFPIRVEIASVRDRAAMTRVFEEYHPQIVVHAAAHKHVPLMEKNCIEAVENNVFGTKNVVELCDAYGAEHFLMVSTDKAVNPTNVMGATKRLCEMITMSHAGGKTVYTATRFGNVLGSAGSVIPLFRRQIEEGGPITVTDKRIVRYFMTIPEASQLVLASGAMAKDGELFVLDMGKPISIYELACTMVSLAGLKLGTDIEIVETGLRQGEKLYEELLVKTDHCRKTDNHMIFIENEQPLSTAQVEEKLEQLKAAIPLGDAAVKEALHRVVPTYREPEAVNREAAARAIK